MPIRCQALFTHIDTFIVNCATDDDRHVRRHVCQAFVLLLASIAPALIDCMVYSEDDRL